MAATRFLVALVAVLGAVGAAGCASTPVAPAALGHIDAPYRATFDAAKRALAPASIENADEKAGAIETGWSESLDESKTQGVVLEGYWVERRRYFVRLWPDGARTAVEVAVRAEERAPGGTRAIRWRRKDVPPAVAEDLIAKIRAEVKK
jgi:hypothetical protein